MISVAMCRGRVQTLAWEGSIPQGATSIRRGLAVPRTFVVERDIASDDAPDRLIVIVGNDLFIR
jgi:hypothetical protein